MERLLETVDPVEESGGELEAAVCDITQSAAVRRSRRRRGAMRGALCELVILRVAVLNRARYEFDAQATIDLTVTIAAYNMVFRFLVALQIGH